MCHLIEAIDALKAEDRMAAKQEAAKQKAEEEANQLKLQQERERVEILYSRARQVLDESGVKDIFDEARTAIFNGDGEVSRSRSSIDRRCRQRNSCGEIRIEGSVDYLEGLRLEVNDPKKMVILEAVATVSDPVHSWNKGELLSLSVKCFTGVSYRHLLKRKTRWFAGSYKNLTSRVVSLDGEMIQEWKDPNEVRGAVAKVLIGQGVV